jgi:DNA polymerase III subunit delta'
VSDFIPIESDAGVDEPDRFRDLPHPREMLACHGHAGQEQALLEAYRSDRMHHGWLFTGPEGVGKAVMAYRLARFLLANPDTRSDAVRQAADLLVPANHPVTGLVARQAHSDLTVIRRSKGKDGKTIRTEIAMEDVRDGLALFRSTSVSGGWRIAIVDAADDLNRNGENALLKMLEEPPRRALFILIANRPGSLLPTIRSRCRTLPFKALPPDEVAAALAGLGRADGSDAQAAALAAGGSVRTALRMLDHDERALRAKADKAFESGGKAVRDLAENLSGRANTERFEIFLEIVEERLRAEIATGGSGEALAARAELWEKLKRSAREVETYNLDRRPFVLSVVSDLREIERRPR